MKDLTPFLRIQTRTEYDSLGLPERTSAPHFAGTTPYWTTFNDYDRLGRVMQKTSPGADIINVITNYTYTGTETKIKVRAANVSGTGNCPTTTNLCMDMRRYTDVLGRLVKTVQALDGNANYATTRYWYDGPGNPVAAEDAEGNVTRATYDARGRRIQMDDPDAGVWDFYHNGAGELVAQTDARDVYTTYDYDALGRVVQRTSITPGTISGPTGTIPGPLPDPHLSVLRDTWDWDPVGAPGQLGELSRQWGPNFLSLSEIWSESYQYSATTQRLGSQQTTIGGSSETTSYTYDFYGREQSRTYPSGVAVKSSYTTYGELSALGPWPSGAAWWTATDKDAWGNVTNETYFGVTTGSHTTWPRTGQYEQKKWTRGAQILDQWDYEYDTFGNLEEQERSVLPGAGTTVTGVYNETYEYDGLQRLMEATRPQAPSINCSTGTCPKVAQYGYTPSGNLSFKDSLGSVYSYGANGCGPHAVSQVASGASRSTTYSCDANGNVTGGNTLSGWYDFNNQPWRLVRTGAGEANFRYTPDGAVFQQDATTHTTSFGPRGYEVTNYAGSTIERHELGPIIVVRENGVNTVRGILRDRLGSLVTMLESGGNFVTYRSYDAFGKTRGGNFDDRPNGTFNFLPHSLHGFTDHNHVDDVWLLHMNGRVYDYQLGRFLSPDPLIQFPANSQSLNPYSYILNNPLAGRDPSGYAVEVAGGSCTKMTGSNICGQDTGAQNGQTSQTYHFSDSRGGHATVTQTRGSNGAIGFSVTAISGLKDQAAPEAGQPITVTGSAPSGVVHMQTRDVTLQVSELNDPAGYADENAGALAQYSAYQAEYLQTLESKDTELLGLGIKRHGRYYFSDVAQVPKQFRASIHPRGFQTSDLAWFAHSHPDSSGFSGVDFETPAEHRLPYFLRNTSINHVYRWNPSGAAKYQQYVERLRRSRSAFPIATEVKNPSKWGISDICGGQPCL